MSVTLLLADDSITIQRVIELTFADEDVRVISASDGQQAIQRIEAERPDIVLADVSMPKVDGYGVAAHVKQSAALRHIPVLLLTGAFEPIDEAKARATGCDGILVKPFKPEELITRVRELVAGQRSEQLWPDELPRVDPPKPVSSPVPVFAPPPMPAPVRPLAVVPPPPPLVVVPEPRIVVSRPPLPPVIEVQHDDEFDTMPGFAARQPPIEPHDLTDPIDHLFVDAEPVGDKATMRPANRNPSQPSSRTQLVARELPPPADAFESELDMLDVALSRLEPTASPQELDAATASDFARDLAALRSEQPDGAPAADASRDTDRQMFGDWDLPAKRPVSSLLDADSLDIDLDVTEPVDIDAEEIPAAAAPAAMIPPKPERVAAERRSEPDAIAPPPAAVVRPTLVAVPPPAPINHVDDADRAPLHVVTTVRTGPVAVPPPAPVAVPMPVAAAVVPPPAPAQRPSLASAFSALLAAERAQPPARELASSTTLSESAIEDVVKRVLARMTDEAVHKVVLDAAERIIREEIDRLKSQPHSGPQAGSPLKD